VFKNVLSLASSNSSRTIERPSSSEMDHYGSEFSETAMALCVFGHYYEERVPRHKHLVQNILLGLNAIRPCFSLAFQVGFVMDLLELVPKEVDASCIIT